MGTMRPKIVGDQAACVRRTPLRKYPVPDFGDARQHLQGSATGSVRDFDMAGALISLSELKKLCGAALGRPIVASLQDHYRASFSTAPCGSPVHEEGYANSVLRKPQAQFSWQQILIFWVGGSLGP